MKTPSRRSPAAFSLVELMTVIAIIVILASIVIGSLAYMRERQAKEKAKVQMSLISKALEDYKHDNGTYPPGDGNGEIEKNSKELFQALYYEGYDYLDKGSPANWVKTVGSNTAFPKATKIYIPELDPENNKQGWTIGKPSESTKITDPWDNEYRYRSATANDGNPNGYAQNPDFDLWSVGKDGKTNSDPKDKTCRDDIKNF